ncbi:PEGA domain-containing protein [Pirellulaceae bacterium]|nr:PEGA domain-containing protein [Pirellulaceae bacterium]
MYCFDMKKSLILLLCGLTIISTGCLRRRLTIRSNPPGALVYVDDVQIGHSPVSVPFTYYGTRTIRLEKDRFKTVEVQQNINSPWYQTPPLDFVSEVLLPFEIRDERAVNIDMLPLEPTNESEVLNRAKQIRQNSNQGFAVPR